MAPHCGWLHVIVSLSNLPARDFKINDGTTLSQLLDVNLLFAEPTGCARALPLNNVRKEADGDINVARIERKRKTITKKHKLLKKS